MASRAKNQEMGFMIEDGVYQLRHDVVNRAGDKRHKRTFDAAPTWKEGLLVEVKNHFDDITLPRIKACNGQDLIGEVVCRAEERDTWEPLLNALDNPPQTVRAVMAVLDSEHLGFLELSDILAYLLDQKIVNYYEVLRAGRELGVVPDDKFYAWRKAQGL